MKLFFAIKMAMFCIIMEITDLDVLIISNKIKINTITKQKITVRVIFKIGQSVVYTLIYYAWNIVPIL